MVRIAERDWPEFSADIVDGTQLTLAEWLDFVLNGRSDRVFPHNAFPTEAHRDEYLRTIDARSECKVLDLVRVFLVHRSTYGHDHFNLAMLKKGLIGGDAYPEYMRRLRELEKSGAPVWEGITWILDLLPHSPREAQEAIKAFMLSSVQLLPDFAISGLGDALSIIRGRFVEAVPPRQALLDLTTRDFEFVASALYRERGYETEVTKATRDGGKDVIAYRNAPGARERTVISAKRLDRDVGVKDVRELHAVRDHNRATKGVLLTTANGFTDAARSWAADHHNLELIPYSELAVMLNEAFGTRWPTRLDSIVAWEKRTQAKQDNVSAARILPLNRRGSSRSEA